MIRRTDTSDPDDTQWVYDSRISIQRSHVIVLQRGENMAKRGGYPGGGMPGNMSNLMKQAQRMQRQMEESQKELETAEYTSAAGGGAVTATVSGKKELTSIKIDPDAVDPEDVEMLEDMIMAAVNEALKQAEEASSQAMSKLTGGLGGLGGMPF